MPGSQIHCLGDPTSSLTRSLYRWSFPQGKVLCKVFIFIRPSVHLHFWKRELKAKTDQPEKQHIQVLSLFSIHHSSCFPPLTSNRMKSVLMLPCKFWLDQLWIPSCSQRKNAITEYEIFSGFSNCRWICPTYRFCGKKVWIWDWSRLILRSPISQTACQSFIRQTPGAAGYRVFMSLKATDTIHLSDIQLLYSQAFNTFHCSFAPWTSSLAIVSSELSKMFLSRHSMRKQ